MGKENVSHTMKDGVSNEDCSSIESEELESHPRHSFDKEAGLPSCRVCQCTESDKMGDAVLGFLGISLPSQDASKSYGEVQPDRMEVIKDIENKFSLKKNGGRERGLVEFIGPDGEVFICNTDLEMGSCHHQDTLVELGCSCKNDLALVHYACALKWFVNHGSTVCEICGCVAKNIRTADFKKVVGSLKEFEALRERTASGEPSPAPLRTNQEYVVPDENPATKWAVEGTGILLATGLLTVTLAWLIAPRVGKKTARSGLHILLGGICALTIVVFFRFFVLTRIKYGPARYWAILFVFWFLVFGIWASRTHGTHSA
ncbi:hypothetical protein I3843_03G111500 [Carya illinoinensis]|uniref:RING-CH-type domain-containing protein n=1 Tax=Carya illinoinensis TaxID=32201 RepID=A0A8T1QZP4_CARIL|nr:uncharacterized protein LOC122303333 isoform X7 [Carya illinoinensis]KAG6660600.1 hypothetical protein CIPAW_03G116400 [Carya illinoinensis]KAG7987013.1 hypothetical protein I3843_03G111500 [Carya illinoinensis]